MALIISIIISFILMPSSSSAGFTVVPMTLNVTAGDSAVFTCRHSSAAFINWRVNNIFTQAINGTISGISTSVKGDTLTILALPENNGIVVECVAFFLNGPPAFTPPVMLIVQGNCQGTVAIAFIEEPESQNVVIGQDAEFRCRHPNANYIGWQNRSSNSIINPRNTSVIRNPLPGGQSRSVLLIGAIPTYNGTVVICVAILNDSCSSQSGPAVLLIQGPLDAVRDIIRGGFSEDYFSWKAPSTIPLTYADPDIAYCVTIHNITCGRNSFLVSDCNVVNPYFTFSDIRVGFVYRIEVIPRSNVEKAANGTPLSVDEKFVEYQVLQINFVTDSDIHNLNITIEFTPNKTVPGLHRIIPDWYEVILTTNDDDVERTNIPKLLEGPSPDGLNISVNLPIRRLWKYNLLAYNCSQHSIGSGMISSHELQTSTTTPQPGKIEVTGEFVDQSTTKGVLIIVYPFGNISNSDVHYVYHEPENNNVDVLVAGLNGIQYGVSVFIVEENGLPFPRVANIPKNIQFSSLTKEQKNAPHTNIEYSLQSTSTGVCITCTFLDSSATDCVAVVHQRISQLSSSGLMYIESSHKLTRSGDTASGCIEGVNMEDYQVGVLNGRALEDDGDGLRQTVIIIITLLLMLMLAVLIVVIIFIVTVRRRRRRNIQTNIGLQENENSVNNNMGKGSEDTQHTESSSDTMGHEVQQGHTNTNNLRNPILETRRSNGTRSNRRGIQPSGVELTRMDIANRPFPEENPDDIRSFSARSDLEFAEPEPSSDGNGLTAAALDVERNTRSDHNTQGILESNDYRILGGPGPLYDLPQLPGSTAVPPSTDIRHQSNEQESPPPVPLWTEDDVLIQESSDTSPGPEDMTLTNIQSPPDPVYAEPQQPGSALIQTLSNEEQALQSPPPVPPKTVDSITLAEESSNFSPTPATDPVVYEEVERFNISKGQHYAMLGDLSTSKKTCTPDDSDQEKTMYSEIQSGSLRSTTALEPDTSTHKNTAETHTDPPFTVENIFPALLFLASKWEALGKALSLDEDLDEIFTNNENDEACLRVMLEHYMKRSDLKHNWEEIREARRKVGEDQVMDADSVKNHEVPRSAIEHKKNLSTNVLVPPPVHPHHSPGARSSSMDVDSCATIQATTFDSATEKYPSGYHIQSWRHHEDNGDAVVDMESDLKEKEIQDHKEGQSLKKGDKETLQKGTISEQTEPSGDAVDEDDSRSQKSTLNHQLTSHNESDLGESTDDLHAAFPPGQQSSEHGSQYTPCIDQTQEKNEKTDLNEEGHVRAIQVELFPPLTYNPSDNSPRLFPYNHKTSFQETQDDETDYNMATRKLLSFSLGPILS